MSNGYRVRLPATKQLLVRIKRETGLNAKELDEEGFMAFVGTEVLVCFELQRRAAKKPKDVPAPRSRWENY